MSTGFVEERQLGTGADDCGRLRLAEEELGMFLDRSAWRLAAPGEAWQTLIWASGSNNGAHVMPSLPAIIGRYSWPCSLPHTAPALSSSKPFFVPARPASPCPLQPAAPPPASPTGACMCLARDPHAVCSGIAEGAGECLGCLGRAIITCRECSAAERQR